MTTLGPLVRRSARAGGALFLFGSLQFIVAMLVVELLWPSTYVSGGPYPTYSPVSNYISDFGNYHYTHLYWLFNGSIILLGLLGILGAALVRSAFQPRTTARAGIAFLAIASLGAVLVGIYPEPSPQLGGNIHSVVSLVTFIGSGLALVFLALGMMRDTRWEGFRGFTLFLGLITLIALAVYAPAGVNWSTAGLVERVIVAPILLWAIVAGVHLLRLPTYAPSRVSGVSEP